MTLSLAQQRSSCAILATSGRPGRCLRLAGLLEAVGGACSCRGGSDLGGELTVTVEGAADECLPLDLSDLDQDYVAIRLWYWVVDPTAGA